MRKIVEKCSLPDEETGTDNYVFVYNLEAGAKVTISGPYLSHIEKISYQPAAAPMKIRSGLPKKEIFRTPGNSVFAPATAIFPARNPATSFLA